MGRHWPPGIVAALSVIPAGSPALKVSPWSGTLGAMILCIGATPALQRVMVFKALQNGAVNRATQTLDGIAGKSINVAKVLKALGEKPIATGFIGGDRGRELKRELEARAIDAD